MCLRPHVSECAIAGSGFVALVIVGEFAIRPQTGLGLMAPKETVVAVWHRRFPVGFDVHALPAQVLAAVIFDIAETGEFHKLPPAVYALPVVASKARFTATLANCTL